MAFYKFLDRLSAVEYEPELKNEDYKIEKKLKKEVKINSCYGRDFF